MVSLIVMSVSEAKHGLGMMTKRERNGGTKAVRVSIISS
jgi:hypothetical protein